MARHRQPLTPALLSLQQRMRELAGPQGGVMSAAQFRRLGGDRTALRHLVDAGQWHPVRRGVYGDRTFRLPARVDARHHRACAGLLAGLAGPAVVSHISAAQLLGLPLPPTIDERVHLTRRPPAATNDPLLADVHVGDYSDADVRLVFGVPVLAGARLVHDCCGVMPPDSALAVADAALFRRITTRSALAATVVARRGRQWSRWAETVVARADPGGRSWFESSSRWWLLELGLPVPRLQVPFSCADGEPKVVDMWFAAHRTVGEADGAGKYEEPGALFAEKRREDWLRDAHQVEVVRWVPAEMRSWPGREGVRDRFLRAFARRS